MLDKRNWRTALGDADHATRTDQIEEPDAALAATTDDKLLGLRAGFDRLAVPVLEGLGDDPSRLDFRLLAQIFASADFLFGRRPAGERCATGEISDDVVPILRGQYAGHAATFNARL